MSKMFVEKAGITRIVISVVLASFVLSSIPNNGYAGLGNSDKLRIRNTADSHSFSRTKIIEDLEKSGYVLTYDNPRSEDPKSAGGKCAQLAWAYNRGIPNPLGFSISVDAVRAYYNHNPELLKMIKEVRELDVTNAKKRTEAAKRIQHFMMTQTTLPAAVKETIKGNLVTMSRALGYQEGEFVPVAYRGSGTIEDFEGTIPFFQKSIGAQPGQGTTLLNKVGVEAIEPSVIEVIAGLFNDQIFVYRDIQIFFDFVSKMKDVSEYNKLIKLTEKYGFHTEAKKLQNENSPGYVNLRKVLAEIETRESGIKEQYGWVARLEKSANDILAPENFVTGIAVLEMVNADYAGTAFTSNMATGFDGSTYAQKTRDKGSVFPSFKDKKESFQGYTRYVKINLGTGLGPGIVEGRFQPNIVTLFDKTGKGDWVFFEFSVGRKHMSLIAIEKVIDSLKPKLTKEQVYRLAKLYADWAHFGKEKDSAKQLEVAGELKNEFNIDADSWARAMADIWYFFEKPDKYKATQDEKESLLKNFKITEKEFFTLSHLVNAINKIATGYDTAAYVMTSPDMASSRLLPDDGYKKLADMIVKVGNTMAQERFAAGSPGWRERRDIEFAVAKCKENDPSKFKVKLEHTYDLITGEDLGAGWVKIVHLQNRPINPEKEIQDPANIIFRRMKVDERYVEDNNIQPLADGGLMGFGAAEGDVFIVDPEKDLADQEEEIKKLTEAGKPQTVSLEEMGPEHDGIVGAAGSAIIEKGNDTSHAYIFSLELRLAMVINAARKAGVQLKHGMRVVLDALHGVIYPGDKGIPLVKDDLIIRVDMLPKKTIVGFIVSTLQTAMEIARIGGKAILVRQEFIINNTIKIYPQAAWTYDLITALDKGQIKEEDLSSEDREDIKALKRYPKDIEAIRNIITGFSSASEFIAEQMHFAANQLGAIFPEDDEIRDYDNKEKEALLSGLIGAKAFLQYDDKDPRFDSPLDGERGSALMTHPHHKKAFFSLKRGVLRSIKDGFKNNAFFFVYLRTVNEAKIQLADFEKLCEEEGVYPESVVMMIENGGNIWIINEVAKVMADFVERHRKDGVKKWKISFGTNDLTNSLGGTSRDDKDFTGDVKIMHPALIDVEPSKGQIEVNPGYVYGPKAKGKPFAMMINDETAPGVLRTVEHVAAVVNNMGGINNLCGQGPTRAYNRGDWQGARRYLRVLDAAGTQSVTFVPLVMLDFDTKASFTHIEPDALQGALSIAKLTNIREEAKDLVVTGDVVVINQPSDIEKLRQGENKQKIVVIKNIWGREELEKNGVKWDYLNYAGAILLDESVKPETGILKEAGVKGRIRATLLQGTSLENGQMVTIDFSRADVYQGTLATYKEKPVFKKLRMPALGVTPETRSIMRISASDLFERKDDNSAEIDIHPLAFVMYKENPDSVPEDAREAIKNLIGSQDPLEYLQGRISEYVAQKAQDAINNGLSPVYTVFRLTRNQMRFLKGGEEIEKTKGKEGNNFDDPRKRLQGGTRALSDFWPIFNLELTAFNEVKTAVPQIALQLSKMGTRVQEIIAMQLRVLKSFGITPEETNIGLELTASIDPIMIEDYIKQGIKFFSYKDKELAEALLAANLAQPHLFTIDGKEATAKQALEKPLEYVKAIIAENKDKGVWLGLTSQQIPAADTKLAATQAKISALSKEVYNSSPSEKYNSLLSSVKDAKRAVVIGANTIFENVAIIPALRELKGFKIVVWANNQAAVEGLKRIGIEEVADIITAEGIEAAIVEVRKQVEGIKNINTVLINSPADLENIKKEFNFKDIAQFNDLVAGLFVNDYTGIKLMNLQTPNAQENSINDFRLIFARAIAGIFSQGEVIAKKYQDFHQEFIESNKDNIDDKTSNAINRLHDVSERISDVPLVKVTEESAKAQAEYEIALEAVGISG